MSSVQHLREFIGARLTAAAAEIFTEFEKTIFQYQEEIDRQRKLLSISSKPQINFRTEDLRQQHGPEDEVLDDQQQCNPEMEPESPLIKKEEEEVWTNQEGDLQKTLIATPIQHENNLDKTESNTFNSICPSAKSQDQEGSIHPELAPIGSLEMKLTRCYRSNKVDVSSVPQPRFNTDSGRKSFLCDVCGKTFQHKSSMILHHRIHTGLKPFSCKTCGKSFYQKGTLLTHTRTHTGEKLYSCEVCGRSFSQSNVLSTHRRVHTGERPFSCATCGKRFITSSNLLRHTRTHTGEKMYVCEVCGKSFSYRRSLMTHMRAHTGGR